MIPDELIELHNITPIANLHSILKYGIQSHNRTEVGRRRGLLNPHSVALREVQDRRSRVQVPGGNALHDYANLYLCARNPMMYVRKDQHQELCVLRLNTDVMNLPGVVVTDRNAAVGICRFYPAPEGLSHCDKDLIFAESWNNYFEELDKINHKAVKCAEVLVPNQVESKYITGIYVSCLQSEAHVKQIVPQIPITIDRHLFFLEDSS